MREEPTTFLGNKVRELRKANALNQDELSILSGISTRTISNIENGGGNPSYVNVDSLIRAFRISADVLFQSEVDEQDVHIKELVANYLACSKEQQELFFEFIKFAALKQQMKSIEKGTEQDA